MALDFETNTRFCQLIETKLRLNITTINEILEKENKIREYNKILNFKFKSLYEVFNVSQKLYDFKAFSCENIDFSKINVRNGTQFTSYCVNENQTDSYVSSVKLFKCDYNECNKSFDFESSLRKHTKMHSMFKF
jgi:hypothetical protein